MVVPADDEEGDMGSLPAQALGDIAQGVADGIGEVTVLGDRVAGFERRRDGPEAWSESHDVG